MGFIIRCLQVLFVSAAIAIGLYGTLTSKPAPTDLAFTATDGTPVNFGTLRGKVILLDFWATSCGPCREEVPNVVAAYNRYHDQGFEVIGVSLDRDLNAMTQFTAANGMPWPQNFDGQGWGNAVARQFHIYSIPTMLLFDKQGRLVTRDGRDDLDRQVNELLRAP